MKTYLLIAASTGLLAVASLIIALAVIIWRGKS